MGRRFIYMSNAFLELLGRFWIRKQAAVRSLSIPAILDSLKPFIFKIQHRKTISANFWNIIKTLNSTKPNHVSKTNVDPIMKPDRYLCKIYVISMHLKRRKLSPYDDEPFQIDVEAHTLLHTWHSIYSIIYIFNAEKYIWSILYLMVKRIVKYVDINGTEWPLWRYGGGNCIPVH